ncbi:hypothetical protein BH11VER1_BH11VER1_28780 [soil metagenome]
MVLFLPTAKRLSHHARMSTDAQIPYHLVFATKKGRARLHMITQIRMG